MWSTALFAVFRMIEDLKWDINIKKLKPLFDFVFMTISIYQEANERSYRDYFQGRGVGS